MQTQTVAIVGDPDDALRTELLHKLEGLRRSVAFASNEQNVRTLTHNLAFADAASKDPELMRALRKFGISLIDNSGAVRPMQDILGELKAHVEARKAGLMIRSGKYVRPALEHENVRITYSGAVYIVTPGKNGKPGPWHRVRGEAAKAIKKELGL